MNFGLYICSFYFTQTKNKKDKTKHILDLNKPMNCEEKGFPNAISEFKKFFVTQVKTQVIDEEQKVFFIEENKEWAGQEDLFEYAMIKVHSGNYGIETDIYDSQTSEKIGLITKEQAVVKTFLVMVVIPKNNDNTVVNKGLMMFQTIGTYGVKTTTTERMKNFLSANANIDLHICNVTDTEFLNNLFQQCDLKKLRLIKNKVSKDSSDRLVGLYAKEERILSRFFEKPAESLVKRLKDFALKKDSVLEWEVGAEYDQIKVEVDTEYGNRRTVDLHHFDAYSIIENIPSQFSKENGNVDENRTLEYLKSRASYYIKKMDVRVQIVK